MTDSSFCGFDGNREDALIACLYDDGAEGPERALFEAHLFTCTRCREELAALRGIRSQLARWAPREPAIGTIRNPQSTVRNPQSAIRNPPWWRQVPAWAQVAAALLFLGVSAAIANLDVRYDANGLRVRTGWMQTPTAPVEGAPAGGAAVALTSTDAATPWRAELAALEQQLRTEMRSVRAAAAQPPAAVHAAAPMSDADLVKRVRALVDESEKRQQRELALRVAEMMRDVATQRQADLMKIDRTLGVVQNNLGVEVMRDRQRLDILYRASQRQ
jgi:hypothetical protein